MWESIVGFFTNVFDTLFFWFRKIGNFINFLATKRAFLIATVIASVKGVYDFAVSSFNEATSVMNSAQISEANSAVTSSFPAMLAWANSIIPVSEALGMMILCTEFYIACTIVKMILCMIPTIK